MTEGEIVLSSAAIFVTVFGVCALLVVRASRTRRNPALRPFVAAHGWTLADRHAPGSVEVRQARADAPWIPEDIPIVVRYHAVQGVVDDTPFYAFEWLQDSRIGGRGTKGMHSTFVIPLPRIRIREQVSVIEASPSSWLRIVDQEEDRLTVESDEFNRRFKIFCADPAFALSLLVPRVLQLLMAGNVHMFRAAEQLTVDYVGRLEPATFEHRVRHLIAVRSVIPDWIWRHTP